MRPIDRTILDFANAHGGVVTKTFLEQVNLTRGQIEWRVRRHGWRALGRGAYRVLEARNMKDRLAGAVAAIEASTVSHESAAELHGFRHLPTGVAVISAHSRTTHRFDGVLVHRTHDLDVAHRTSVDGLPCTTVARTVVDLAPGVSDLRLAAILDDLVVRRRVELADVDMVLSSVARQGKPGVRRMRRVLSSRWGADHSASILERRARSLLARSGLPRPVSEFPIPWSDGRRFDDAYPISGSQSSGTVGSTTASSPRSRQIVDGIGRHSRTVGGSCGSPGTTSTTVRKWSLTRCVRYSVSILDANSRVYAGYDPGYATYTS